MIIILWSISFVYWGTIFIFQFKDLLDFKEFGLTGIIALAELGIIFYMIKRFLGVLDRLTKKGAKDE